MIACFFLINQIVYHHPLGVQAWQVLEEFSPRSRLADAENIFSSIENHLFSYFSLFYFTFLFISSAIFTTLFVIGLHINIYLGINYCDPSKNT